MPSLGNPRSASVRAKSSAEPLKSIQFFKAFKLSFMSPLLLKSSVDFQKIISNRECLISASPTFRCPYRRPSPELFRNSIRTIEKLLDAQARLPPLPTSPTLCTRDNLCPDKKRKKRRLRHSAL